MKEPKWLETAVFYEIYPQSYYDTNRDGIGDIQGIIEKLDYVKSLGCNAIWLNPWYDSPFNDAGYDIRNFYMVAPRYGTNDDAKRLFEEAHKKDMKIVIDLVAGHTSMDNQWFLESQKCEKNQYSDRYIWSPFIAWRGDNNLHRNDDYYISGFCQKGAYKVNFYYNQPALNYGYYKPVMEWEQPMDAEGAVSTKNEIANVMRFWMDMGCDGFRVDMAASLIKRDSDKKGNIKLWNEYRKMFNEEYPNCVLISEWGNPSMAIKAGFHCDFGIGATYDGLVRDEYAWTMPGMPLYPDPVFSEDGKGDAAKFFKGYLADYEATKGKGYISMFSGNHDVRRIAKYLKPEAIKVFFAFLMTMPGVPFVYYGDEIGMKYLDVPSKEGGDVRTGARTPMQWNNWDNKGFSTGRAEDLYLPVDESSDAPTVNAQYDDPNSILTKLRELISIRNSHKTLSGKADFKVLYAKKNQFPFVYERSDKKNRYIIVINPTKFHKPLELKIKSCKKLEVVSEMNMTASCEDVVKFNCNKFAYGIYKVK